MPMLKFNIVRPSGRVVVAKGIRVLANRDKRAAMLACHGLLVLLVAACLGGVLLQPAVAQGADRWVTDDFEVTMRTGKSNRQSIVRMLSSGSKVELIELDQEAGYALVRTSGGAEGWVLSRYLLAEPPARIRLPAIEKQLERSQASRNEMQQQLREVSEERNQLRRRVSDLESAGEDLDRQLKDVRRLSANVIEVDEQNKQLRERLAAAEQTVTDLQRENEKLSGRAAREWFVVGAGVVVFGMVLGLVLPRIRWRRKSSWSDF
jgi:SH3 domain protein